DAAVEPALLRQVGDPRPGPAGHVVPVEPDGAGVGLEDVGDHPDERGLAGAVGAEQGEDLARRHVERDAVHDRAPVVALQYVADFEHGIPRGVGRGGPGRGPTGAARVEQAPKGHKTWAARRPRRRLTDWQPPGVAGTRPAPAGPGATADVGRPGNPCPSGRAISVRRRSPRPPTPSETTRPARPRSCNGAICPSRSRPPVASGARWWRPLAHLPYDHRVRMNDRSITALSRRAAPRLVLSSLIAMAFVGGCECNSANPVGPIVLPPLSAVVVTPGADTVRVGDTVHLTAVALDTLGQPVAGAGFTWKSADPSICSTGLNGLVTGVAEGLDTVYAKTSGGRTGYATVFVFRDSGWVVQPSATQRNLHGVFFQPDGQPGWAVGDAGAIIHTGNAGAQWSSQASRTSYNLNGVWFTSAGEGWAVGNFGTLMHTTDAGANWN